MQSVESIIETTMARLKTIVDVNTIVGEPIPAGNGVVVPVSKVSFGFFSGGGEYAPMGKVAGAALAEQKSFPFLGTAVAGVSLTPKAFWSPMRRASRWSPPTTIPPWIDWWGSCPSS